MDPVTVNIRVIRKIKEKAQVSGYLYKIGDFDVVLHEDHYKKGTYSCSDYFTGLKMISQMPDMQSALDAVTKRIAECDAPAILNTRNKIIKEEGYMNEPGG